jgi:hypothetical protein
VPAPVTVVTVSSGPDETAHPTPGRPERYPVVNIGGSAVGQVPSENRLPPKAAT